MNGLDPDLDAQARHRTRIPTPAPRWRVIVLDDDARAGSSLGDAILTAGGRPMLQSARGASALALLQDTRPDVVILAAPPPGGDTLEVAVLVAATAECPVVLFGPELDPALMARAVTAGVMAFLLKPLRPAQLAPTLDLAVARFREVLGLRRALAERKVIERAKGRLMARDGLTEEEAFRRIRSAAMDSRRPMVDVAAQILAPDGVQGSSSSRATAKAGASAPARDRSRSKRVYGFTLPRAAMMDSATPGWRPFRASSTERISRLMLSFSPHTQPSEGRPQARA